VDESAAPLTEHLGELRKRLFRVLIALALGTAAAWSFKEQIFGVVLQPATRALGGGQLQAIAPTEIFFTYLKSAVLAGLVLALPVIFWQIWAFIAPGLYDKEKRVAVPFVLTSTLLFIGGCAFGHQIVFPLMFSFFQGYESEFVVAAWTMREVFGLTARLFLAFGVAFQLPVLVVFLALAGIVNARQLISWSPYAVLFSFVAAALLTPADVVSQVFLAVPLIVLYFLGVGAAFIVAPRKKPGEDDADSLEPQ
jgi:sec-independent protein translocase protein TatC